MELLTGSRKFHCPVGLGFVDLEKAYFVGVFQGCGALKCF